MISMYLYILFLSLFTAFTWCFVGRNFSFPIDNPLSDFADRIPKFLGVGYCIFVVVFFLFYLFFFRKAQKGILKSKQVWRLIVITVLILLPSFPAFSYDIFNYIATAKVSFLYKENPYIVMPIEIPNEPMLTFMHAANKVALYGPSWILLTYVPHVFGLNNLLLTIYTFKSIMLFFYLGLCYLIWKLSHRNIFSLVFFALNPLVLMETLISSHNDVVMMFFALISFFMLKQKKIGFSIFFYIASVGIKYATIFLLPVYIYALFASFGKKKIFWDYIWFWSAISMFIVFILSPVREEIYSWYLIWPFVFVSLMPKQNLIRFITLGLSFGLLFRFAPFLFTLSWDGKAPIIKKIVTFIPPILFGMYYEIRKKV